MCVIGSFTRSETYGLDLTHEYFCSQIVAVDLADGSSIAYSIGPVPGIVAGTPRITEDQQHLIVTSNTENLSRGHFTVWNVASGTSVLEFASSENRTEPLPFSPLGFQHSPIQGYYDGGFENGNDIFVWGVDNELSSDPAAGLGQLYAFQFPILETDPLRVTLVGGSRGFQTPTEPVFDNGGLSMYWTVTRNELRCWVGEVNMGRDSFDKRPETIDVIPKDSPRANTGMAPPVVTTTSVYGPMAGSQIFRIDLSCAVEELVIVDTAASVNSKILPSLDERFVFYATIEPDSKLYMLNAETMEQVWEHQLTRGVEADMTLSPDGTTVYVVSAGGVLEAVNVGELVALPTESPTRMPTTSPTISSQPTTSAEPTFSATESPTSAPATESPTLAPIMDKSVTDNGTPTPPSSSVTKPTLLVALVIQLLALLC